MGGMVLLAGAQMGLGMMQGRAQEKAYKMDAQQAGLEAKSAELGRRRELNEALSMQAAITGASGRVAGEGSIAAIQREDMRRAGQDIAMIKSSGKAKQASLRAAGASARTSAITSGISGLFEAGLKTSQIGGKKIPKKAD